MISDNYQYLLGMFGDLAQAEPVAPASHAGIGRLLPPELAGFLFECGTGLWLDGRFQFCDPLRFQPIVDLLLQADMDLRPDRTAMFGYSAFGEIMAWNQDHGLLQVNLPRLWASVSHVVEGGTADQTIIASLAGIGDLNYGDWHEDGVDGAPLLFKRVRKARGALALGEVYGFVPALEAGGEAHVETARRLKALEHFAILAQFGPVTLFDYSSGEQVRLRELGPQGG
ncbi:GAD-like domain-containing protein [Novosphingobium album (ex Liu et al. 2023)]|uniref:GAD-like domain-containing protein n=1 Tax=Novosphingobium album (ex Liu et al. 2023) TaxID=3031130 RepID=A0ABT5WV14_9SPHN|nr:GAD-like domain-containing protein [Novosphingobium album (ex Liu et al. 2023)]MDE8653719.1 GAD-like domain-containing protein [Novosphingobium album (ex Liu et al. 2023)]